jgi:hypothetical protein
MIGTIIAALTCWAEPNRLQYDLEERCGKQAREIFYKDWQGNTFNKTEDGLMRADFESHYNPAMNKCFYLLTVSYYITKAKPNPGNMTTFILLDVNENREIGELLRFQDNRIAWCYVGQTNCESAEQWDTLIRPYMER